MQVESARSFVLTKPHGGGETAASHGDFLALMAPAGVAWGAGFLANGAESGAESTTAQGPDPAPRGHKDAVPLAEDPVPDLAGPVIPLPVSSGAEEPAVTKTGLAGFSQNGAETDGAGPWPPVPAPDVNTTQRATADIPPESLDQVVAVDSTDSRMIAGKPWAVAAQPGHDQPGPQFREDAARHPAEAVHYPLRSLGVAPGDDLPAKPVANHISARVEAEPLPFPPQPNQRGKDRPVPPPQAGPPPLQGDTAMQETRSASLLPSASPMGADGQFAPEDGRPGLAGLAPAGAAPLPEQPLPPSPLSLKAATTVAPPPPAAQQVVQAAVRLTDGAVELRLEPEELGRLRMSLVPDGEKMRVLILAERPETLDLLRRHSAELERDLRALGYASTEFRFTGQDRRAPQSFGGESRLVGLSDAAGDDISPVSSAPLVLAPGRLDLRL